MRDEDHVRLQDYLDGRLDADARATFESRLREEPELARCLAAAEAVRRALREDPVALPPGFVARARERFERETGRRRGFHVLSWESAGLAAAALLALALFAPWVTGPDAPPAREEIAASREQERPAAGRPGFAGPSAESGARESGVADATGDLAAIADDDDRDRVRSRKSVARAESAPAEAAPAPRHDAGSVAPPRPTAPAPAAVPQDAARDVGERRRAEAQRPAPGALLDESTPRADRKNANEPQRLAKASERDRFAAASAPVAVAPLTGTVGLDAFELHVLDAAAWEARLADRDGAVPADLGAPAGRRLLLVGPRGVPLDCAAIRIDGAGRAWRVRLPAHPGEATAGCAVALPNDGRPIVLVEPDGRETPL